jgi:LPS sulfotransferase NodH
VRHLARATFGHRAARRFVVVTRSRSGSNMLLSMLNSHPAIEARGEVFAHIGAEDAPHVVAKLFASRVPREVEAIGCKCFYYHPLRQSPEPLWRALRQVPDLRVLHLRRNPLRSIVSEAIARQQGDWLLHEGSDRPDVASRRVHLPVENVRTHLVRVERWEREFTARAGGLPILDVEFETLVDAPESTFAHVTTFIGVERIAPRVTTQRQNPEPLSDLVMNFHELEIAFDGTKWATLFD